MLKMDTKIRIYNAHWCSYGKMGIVALKTYLPLNFDVKIMLRNFFKKIMGYIIKYNLYNQTLH